MGMAQRRLLAPLAVIGVAGIALAGCSGGPGAGNNGDNSSGGADDNVVTVYGTIADTEAELL